MGSREPLIAIGTTRAAAVLTGPFQTGRSAAGAVLDPCPTFTVLPEAMGVYDEMKTLSSGRL